MPCRCATSCATGPWLSAARAGDNLIRLVHAHLTHQPDPDGVIAANAPSVARLKLSRTARSASCAGASDPSRVGHSPHRIEALRRENLTPTADRAGAARSHLLGSHLLGSHLRLALLRGPVVATQHAEPRRVRWPRAR
jgi:hypothetical protein